MLHKSARPGQLCADVRDPRAHTCPSGCADCTAHNLDPVSLAHLEAVCGTYHCANRITVGGSDQIPVGSTDRISFNSTHCASNTRSDRRAEQDPDSIADDAADRGANDQPYSRAHRVSNGPAHSCAQ
jgi:hypothetical protein